MKKIFKLLLLIISIGIIIALLYLFLNNKPEEQVVIVEEVIPESIQIEQELDIKPTIIVEDKEVINSNNNIEENTYEAMVVNVDSIINDSGEMCIKVMLVNGNVFDAVFDDSEFDIDNLNMADEIKFVGEIKDNKIYIKKILDHISFEERI